MPSKGWDKIVGAIRPNRNLPDFLMGETVETKVSIDDGNTTEKVAG